MVLSLIHISTLSDGQVVYRPAESLLRSEIAAIIWRIQQAKED